MAYLPLADSEILISNPFFSVEERGSVRVLRLQSADGMNRLERDCVLALTEAVVTLAMQRSPLIITGNREAFSVGADLNQIVALNGPDALAFARMGQELMSAVVNFPAPICAAISGYCMGGGLDLALACHKRVAAPNAVFGHRGAALGLITGWGGTQRLPRLVGKGRALQMLTAAEKLSAGDALRIGLVDAVADDPIEHAVRTFAPPHAGGIP